LTEHDDVTGTPMIKIRSENAAKQRFLKKCTALIMVIRFAPNKNNNQRVEQEVWRGTNCCVKISLINSKVPAICTVQRSLML